MRKSYFLIVSKINLSFLLILVSGVLFSQSQAIASKTKWCKFDFVDKSNSGYGSENVAVGVRYNELYKESDFVYSSALTPFIRVYFLKNQTIC
jgi:hypothetical protein